jgi:glutamate-1-semialdehyde 2,1-aminomutase
MPQPYWWDEQWTISVAHTEADIDRHLEALAEILPDVAAEQRRRGTKSAPPPRELATAR